MIGSKVNDILIFLSVAETGSFVAGGRTFGLSRSTAGKAVARLEDRYGVRLLNRTTRTLSLTEKGRSLYEHGQAIRTAIEAADASVAGGSGVPRGLLRIAAPDALGRRLLLPAVQRFMDAWPEAQVELSFSDRVTNIVEEGFDLAIRVGMTSPNDGLISRTLLTDSPVLCANRFYLRERGEPLSVEQLSRHEVLQFSGRGERQIWRLQDGDAKWIRAPGHMRLRLDSAEALRDAALAGLGIALLPRLLVGEDIAAGRLVHVLPHVNCGDVPIIALYPHKRFLEPRIRQFIDILTDHLHSSAAH